MMHILFHDVHLRDQPVSQTPASSSFVFDLYLISFFGNSRSKMFFKIVVLEKFAIFTENACVRASFNKTAGLEGLQLH